VTVHDLNAGLVDAKGVAAYLGVNVSFVYEHADELGARRLGSGPKARLRFDLADARKWLDSCSSGRKSPDTADGVVTPIRWRRAQPSLGTDVVLLPIRGVSEAA
jgi:hypothetical protein